MAFNGLLEIQEPSIDSDKLSYEIFSILETKFLFGYDDKKLWMPRQNDTVLVPEKQTSEHASWAAAFPDAKSNHRPRVCILSIDGGYGGMRGFLPVRALAHLERALREKSANPNARIADFFDLAAGTGAGGIFSAMLFATKDGSQPIFDADGAWRFLKEEGYKVFKPPPGPKKQSSGGFLKQIVRCGSGSVVGSRPDGSLEKWTREAFLGVGKRELTLKDTLRPILIPCYDLSTTAPFVFSRADALESDSYNFRLWEVCCATSSEPVSFDPVHVCSVDGRTRCVAVDGGLTMSNPTAAAITHVLHNKRDFPHVRGMEDLLILSLGSGQMHGSEYEQVKVRKAKYCALPVGRIASDGSSDVVDQAVAMAFGPYRSENYVRIQGTGSTVDTELTPITVNKLIDMTEQMLNQRNVESVLFGGRRVTDCTNFDKLDWFAEQLEIEHRRRNPHSEKP